MNAAAPDPALYIAAVARLPQGGFTSPLLVCTRCGAAVGDRDLHDRFHDVVDRKIRASVGSRAQRGEK